MPQAYLVNRRASWSGMVSFFPGSVSIAASSMKLLSPIPRVLRDLQDQTRSSDQTLPTPDQEFIPCPTAFLLAPSVSSVSGPPGEPPHHPISLSKEEEKEKGKERECPALSRYFRQRLGHGIQLPTSCQPSPNRPLPLQSKLKIH